jgi:predicted ATPase
LLLVRAADSEPDSSEESAPASLPTSPLVGRAAVLERLTTLLEAVTSGSRARAVVVSGEPGIGKSRLARALLQQAKAREGRVLTGRAFESESTHPYAVWLDAFRHPPTGWDRTASGELRELLSRVPSDDRTSREQLFGAVAGHFARAAPPAPFLLVVLDDVQWCDEGSTELLLAILQTCRASPALFLLSARSGELLDNPAIMRLLRVLRREFSLEELSLEPLSPEAVAELVSGPAP